MKKAEAAAAPRAGELGGGAPPALAPADAIGMSLAAQVVNLTDITGRTMGAARRAVVGGPAARADEFDEPSRRVAGGRDGDAGTPARPRRASMEPCRRGGRRRRRRRRRAAADGDADDDAAPSVAAAADDAAADDDDGRRRRRRGAAGARRGGVADARGLAHLLEMKDAAPEASEGSPARAAATASGTAGSRGERGASEVVRPAFPRLASAAHFHASTSMASRSRRARYPCACAVAS